MNIGTPVLRPNFCLDSRHVADGIITDLFSSVNDGLVGLLAGKALAK